MFIVVGLNTRWKQGRNQNFHGEFQILIFPPVMKCGSEVGPRKYFELSWGEAPEKF
jgi:hypothetical protein